MDAPEAPAKRRPVDTRISSEIRLCSMRRLPRCFRWSPQPAVASTFASTLVILLIPLRLAAMRPALGSFDIYNQVASAIPIGGLDMLDHYPVVLWHKKLPCRAHDFVFEPFDVTDGLRFCRAVHAIVVFLRIDAVDDDAAH